MSCLVGLCHRPESKAFRRRKQGSLSFMAVKRSQRKSACINCHLAMGQKDANPWRPQGFGAIFPLPIEFFRYPVFLTHRHFFGLFIDLLFGAENVPSFHARDMATRRKGRWMWASRRCCLSKTWWCCLRFWWFFRFFVDGFCRVSRVFLKVSCVFLVIFCFCGFLWYFSGFLQGFLSSFLVMF